MAKSYFGKYESQWDAQEALDQGNLLKPFVAIYDDAVHYDDLNEVAAGEVETLSYDDISWAGEQLSNYITVPVPGSLNWEIHYDPAVLTILPFNYSDSSEITIDVAENDGLSSRDISFDVEFRYGDDTAYTRNIVTVNIQQNAATVEPGYVDDGNGNIVTSITATYNEGTAAYLYPTTDGEKPLYWVATSDADWFFFGNTASAWTDEGSPTEIYAYQNPGENSRSTNITVSFYLDDQMQNLVNTVTIPFTQAGHIVQPGYVDPSTMSMSSNHQEGYFMVYGDDLYWELTTDDRWIADFNWGSNGQGTQQKAFVVNENNGADRSGVITVNFYTDVEMTVLKNSVDLTVAQEGNNQFIVSWDDVNEVNLTEWSSGAGITNIYVLNNPDGYYLRYGGVSADPQTTAFTISYQAAQVYDTKQYAINIEVYRDSAYTDYYTTAWLFANQEGDTNLSHILIDAEEAVPASGGTKVANIVLLGEAVKWELFVLDNALSFPDYPGETTITGDSSTTAVTVNVSATTSFWGNTRTIYAKFYDQNDQIIGAQQQVEFYQQAFRPVRIKFAFNDEEHVYLPGSFTGDVVCNVTVDGTYYYKIEDNNEVLIASGDSTSAVTVATISQPNTSGSQTGMGYHVTIYTDSGYTQTAYDEWIGYDQFPLPSDGNAYLYVIEHYNVATDGETKQVNHPMDGFGGYSQFVVYDGTYCVETTYDENTGNHYYTFPQSGDHTLGYLRVSNDLKMQGWCQNTDAVEVECIGHNVEYSYSPVGGYGFHGDGNGYTFSGCTALTEITFDEYMLDIGGGDGVNNTFDGCTSLTTISCYNPNEPAINGSFNTITANTGTLHIPSGASYPSWETALGSNWTVVDDL